MVFCSIDIFDRDRHAGTSPDQLAPGNVVRLGAVYKTRTVGGFLDLARHFGTSQVLSLMQME
jgi:hypothetical protein